MIEGELCLLGFVDGKCDPNTAASNLDSRIGGAPAWHASTPSSPACSRCSGDMHFVTQIYAPTEIHRSLYIYCCKDSHCVLESSGWAVRRDQRPYVEDCPADVTDWAASTPGEAPSVPSIPTFSSVFDTNAWGDDTGDGLDDLEALLQQRDGALTAPQERVAPSPAAGDKDTSPAGEARKTAPVDALRLKEFYLRHESEPCPSARRGAKSGSDAHIQGLMSRYIAEEREGLQETGSGGIDAATLRLIEESMKRDRGEGSDSEHEDDYDSDSEKVLTKKETKTEAKFRARLSLAPNQVLRYAYGGEPLWCVDRESGRGKGPRGADVAVPRCESCGGERLFEMQLMPAMAEYLDTVATSSTAKEVDVRQFLQSRQASSAPAAEGPPLDGLQVLRLSMGVLCVWSCEASCDGGSNEFAVFQPLA